MGTSDMKLDTQHQKEKPYHRHEGLEHPGGKGLDTMLGDVIGNILGNHDILPTSGICCHQKWYLYQLQHATRCWIPLVTRPDVHAITLEIVADADSAL